MVAQQELRGQVVLAAVEVVGVMPAVLQGIQTKVEVEVEVVLVLLQELAAQAAPVSSS
jgi:hypothetical protein